MSQYCINYITKATNTCSPYISKVRECLIEGDGEEAGVWRRVLQLTQDTGTHKHRGSLRITLTPGVGSTDLPLNLHGAREVITIQNTWKQG